MHPRRNDFPNSFHHVYFHSVPEIDLYRDEIDRAFYVKKTREIFREAGAVAHAIALLSTHGHAGVQVGLVPLSEIFHRIHTAFARMYNERWERKGPVFMDRFQSKRVHDDAYYRRCLRYILRNPLEAGIVRSLSELERYRFCSYGALLGRASDGLVDVNAVLRRFGPDAEGARDALRAWMREPVPDDDTREFSTFPDRWDVECDVGPIEFKRAAARPVEGRFGHDWSLDRLVAVVSSDLGIRPDELSASTRRPRQAISDARAVIGFFATTGLGVAKSTVARQFNVSPQAMTSSVERGARLAAALELDVDALELRAHEAAARANS